VLSLNTFKSCAERDFITIQLRRGENDDCDIENLKTLGGQISPATERSKRGGREGGGH